MIRLRRRSAQQRLMDLLSDLIERDLAVGTSMLRTCEVQGVTVSTNKFPFGDTEVRAEIVIRPA